MSKHKLITIVAVLVLGFAVFAGINQGKHPVVEKQTLKIGVILPLSGNAAFLGESAQHAADMAIADLKSKDTKHVYEVVIEDDGFNPTRTVSAVQKLISVDKVGAVITFGSGTSNAVSPITEVAKVPHYGLASDPTSAKGEYNYIHWTPPQKEGATLASEIKIRGYKRVAIIDANHPGTMAVSSAAKEALQTAGVEVVKYSLTNVGEKDFRTVVQGVKDLNPDIIVLNLFSPEIEIAAKQIKALGIKVPLTSVENIGWSNDIGLFEGDWFVDASRSDKFDADFTARYGKAPSPGSSYIYDLIMFNAQMYEKSNTLIDQNKIPGLIQAIGQYDSPVFGKIAIDAEGFFMTEATVKEVRDGKVVLIK